MMASQNTLSLVVEVVAEVVAMALSYLVEVVAVPGDTTPKGLYRKLFVWPSKVNR